jgi:hypothetical protein
MIDDVDEAVRALIRREALNGTSVEVVFDAPTKEWSSRRNSPTLDVYLYDLREDMRRRELGMIDIHGDDGHITGRRRPPRHYKLSYLITAWTQRPEDEHRLLAAVLACFARHDKLPADLLRGALADQAVPVPVTVALPPPEDRALSDVWSALGGELKPSLDLVVTLPFDTVAFIPVATLVTEQPRIGVGAPGGRIELHHRRSRSSSREPEPAAGSAGPKGSAKPQRGKGKGRAAAATETSAEGAAKATPGAQGGAGAGRPDDPADAPVPDTEETVRGGAAGDAGRIYRWRNIAES